MLTSWMWWARYSQSDFYPYGGDVFKVSQKGAAQHCRIPVLAEPKSAGKWYLPVYISEVGNYVYGSFGFIRTETSVSFTNYLLGGADSTQSVGWTKGFGSYVNNAVVDAASIPETNTWGTIAIDIDLGEARLFGNTGTQIGSTVTGLPAYSWMPCGAMIASTDHLLNWIGLDPEGNLSNATPPAGYTLWPFLPLELGTASSVTPSLGLLRPALDTSNRYGHTPVDLTRLGDQHTDVSLTRRLYGNSWFGDGVISGNVTTLGSPTIDLVRIYDRLTGIYLGTTRSAADGTYSFVGLDPSREYLLVGLDKERTYEAVARDLIVPEVPA